MIGFNTGFGWLTRNGLNGGVLMPPNVDDILAWYNSNAGLSLLDTKDIVNPEPIIGDVGIATLGGASYMSLPTPNGGAKTVDITFTAQNVDERYVWDTRSFGGTSYLYIDSYGIMSTEEGNVQIVTAGVEYSFSIPVVLGNTFILGAGGTGGSLRFVGDITSLSIGDNGTYRFAESSGLDVIDTSGLGCNGTYSTNATHGVRDGIESINIINGGSQYLDFKNTDQVIMGENSGLGGGDFYYSWEGITTDEGVTLDALWSNGDGYAGGIRQGILMSPIHFTASIANDAVGLDLSLNAPLFIHNRIVIEFERVGTLLTFTITNMDTGYTETVSGTSAVDTHSDQLLVLGGGHDHTNGDIIFKSKSKCSKFNFGVSRDDILFAGVAINGYIYDKIDKEIFHLNDITECPTQFITALPEPTIAVFQCDGIIVYGETNIVALADTTWEVRGSFDTIDNYAIMGSTSFTTNSGFYFGVVPDQWVFGYAGGIYVGGTSDTDVHDFKIEGGKFYIDDVLIADESARMGSFVPVTDTLTIGALSHSSVAPSDHCQFKTHTSKLTRGDTILQNSDFTAVVGKSTQNVSGCIVEHGILDDIWSTRIYDVNGIIVDGDYRPPTNDPCDGGAVAPVEAQYALISDGNQYIDTGFIPTGTKAVKATYKFDTLDIVTNGYGHLCAAKSAEGLKNAMLPSTFRWGTESASFIVSWGTSFYQHFGSPDLDWHTWEMRSDRKYYQDDNLFYDASAFSDYTGENSMWLGTRNTDGTSDQPTAGRWQDFVGYSESGVVDVHLTPVPMGSQMHGASSVAPSNCMYDMVADTYHENVGTGTFSIETITEGVAGVKSKNGLVHNCCEVSIIQSPTATQLLDSVDGAAYGGDLNGKPEFGTIIPDAVVFTVGGDNYVLPRDSDSASHPRWTNGMSGSDGIQIRFEPTFFPAKWVSWYKGSWIPTHGLHTGDLPPKDDWVDYGGDAVSLAYGYDGRSIHWTGTKWAYSDVDTPEEEHPTATGQYPPKTGWLSGLVLEYDSNWIDDDGELVKRFAVDFITGGNFNGNEIIKFKEMTGGGCGVKEIIDYSQTTDITLQWYEKALKYVGKECPVKHIEPLKDVNGNYLYDSLNEMIFVQPEGQ